MDVFSHLEDTMDELYSSRNPSSADHSLQSPDMSALATSPQSIFMYEHDSEPVPYSKPSIDNNNTLGDRNPLSNPLFEAPCWPEEMSNLGCDDLTDSFMSESSLCGSSLCGSSFNDSVKDSVWDFAGYDDVSSPLQHPDDDFLHSPTLAELNMEDTHDMFACGSQRQSAFSTTQKKTKPVLIKQSSHRQAQHIRVQDKSSSLRRKTQPSSTTRDHKYSSLFTVAKSNPLPTNIHHPKKSLHNPIKGELSSPDMTPELHSTDTTDSIGGASRTNCLSFTNLFGRRTRTFATSLPQLHQQQMPSLDDAKIVIKMEPRDARNIDENSVDRKWEEIKSFIHQDPAASLQMAAGALKKEEYDDDTGMAASPTKLTFKKHAHGYSVKSEKKDYSSSQTTGDDGFDSHDEGLGSEHDEMEEGSEDDDESRMEDDEASDLSDVEEEPGLSSLSMQAATAKYRTKSRRSEYDDMTPNPRKLLHIGNELRKLNKIISDMAPVSELTGSARNRCRKEKNKLASRACRLKKKAQHEANKIKLSGLEDESTRLMVVLTAIKKDMVQKVRRPHVQLDGSLTHKLDDLIKNNLGQMVAGHTNEYVNRVMEKTAREKSVNLKSPKGS